jgi:hypothetical protein
MDEVLNPGLDTDHPARVPVEVDVEVVESWGNHRSSPPLEDEDIRRVIPEWTVGAAMSLREAPEATGSLAPRMLVSLRSLSGRPSALYPVLNVFLAVLRRRCPAPEENGSRRVALEDRPLVYGAAPAYPTGAGDAFFFEYSNATPAGPPPLSPPRPRASSSTRASCALPLPRAGIPNPPNRLQL